MSVMWAVQARWRFSVLRTFGMYRPAVVLNRFASTTKQTETKQGKTLRKLMAGKGGNKKWYKDPSMWATHLKSGTSDYLQPRKSNVKDPLRVTVLNTMFMEYITDIVASGELDERLMGKGLEITGVKVNQTYNCLNVYWSASNHDTYEELQETLNGLAGKLRSILCGLNVMGMVPYIIFVKAKLQSNFNEVQIRLAKADFGPDFLPSDPSYPIITTCELNKRPSLDPDTMQELKEREVEQLHFPASPDVTPSLLSHVKSKRSDIYGLDRDELMKQVVQGMYRAKGLQQWAKGCELSSSEMIGVQGERIASGSKEANITGVKEFVMQQRKLKKSLKKHMEEMIENPMPRESGENDYGSVEYDIDSVDDYLVEEDEADWRN